MDPFVEWAMDFLRDRLNHIIQREVFTVEDLNAIIYDLLDLSADFEDVVQFIEDNINFRLQDWKKWIQVSSCAWTLFAIISSSC